MRVLAEIASPRTRARLPLEKPEQVATDLLQARSLSELGFDIR